MEASPVTLTTLFEREIRYEMPPNQRRYVWEQARQWEPLWLDIRNVAERLLQSLESDDSTSKHFFGAVVLHNPRLQTGHVPRPKVVDGQQRLTTFQLLLKALSEVFDHHQHRRAAGRIRRWIQNGEDFLEDEDDVFKVWPTDVDQNAFRKVMLGEARGLHHHRLYNAYNYFYDRISRWINLPEDSENRVVALENAVKYGVQFIAIDIEDDEDPHKIFETLNARGQSLAESELVKNEIMRRTSDHGPWNFDADDWWRTEDRSDVWRRSNVDIFLNHMVGMWSFANVNHAEVFTYFQTYCDTIPDSVVHDVAERVGIMGEDYRRIRELAELPHPDSQAHPYYRIITMSDWNIFPILLRLGDQSIPHTERDAALRALDSYLVRRKICQDTENTGERFQSHMMGLLRKIDGAEAEQVSRVAIDHLSQQIDGEKSISWPSDEAFRDAFRDYNMYEGIDSRQVKAILFAVECELIKRSVDRKGLPYGETAAVAWSALTVEHVLPQSWSSWAADLDIITPDIVSYVDEYQAHDYIVSAMENAKEYKSQNQQHEEAVNWGVQLFVEDMRDYHQLNCSINLIRSVRSFLRNHIDRSLGSKPAVDAIHNLVQIIIEEVEDENNLRMSMSNARGTSNLNNKVGTIGNLTLLTGSLNRDIGNDRWIVKSEALKAHSQLRLTEDLLEGAGELQWNEELIESRSMHLFEIAQSIWPSPEAMTALSGRRLSEASVTPTSEVQTAAANIPWTEPVSDVAQHAEDEWITNRSELRRGRPQRRRREREDRN